MYFSGFYKELISLKKKETRRSRIFLKLGRQRHVSSILKTNSDLFLFVRRRAYEEEEGRYIDIYPQVMSNQCRFIATGKTSSRETAACVFGFLFVFVVVVATVYRSSRVSNVVT